MASSDSTLSALPTRSLIGQLRVTWLSLTDVCLALEFRDNTVQDRNPSMTNVLNMISVDFAAVLDELENRDVF
jgi:hypothetical protein